MWLLLVTTVAIVVLADAGYLYNAPGVPFSLPSNNNIRYDYNKQEEIKSNVNFKNDYIYNNNVQVHQMTANNNQWQVSGNAGYAGIQGGLLNPQTSGIYGTDHLSNGFGGYTEPFKPLINFNNNYAQNNFQNAGSSISSSANVGLIQTSSQSANSGVNLPVNTGYSNSYNSPLHDTNKDSGYTQTLPASGKSYYNIGYPQTHAPSVPAALQNNYGQPFVPIAGNNLKSTFTNAAAADSYSGGYTQSFKPQTSASLNNGYNQAVQPNVHLNNAYSQTATSSVTHNLNSGNVQNFTPFNSNNGYTQTISSSVSNQYDSGYVQTSASLVGVNFNNGYDQSSKSGTTNLNPGVQQTSTSSGTNIYNALVSQTPEANGSSDNSYSQVSTGPTHIDLSSDLVQFSSTSSTNSGNNLDNRNSNNAIVQKNSKDAAKTSSSYTGVTPIVHKHLYFHVPPPEIEEPKKSISPSLPPKKNYKILFIKMPSQESKSNLIRLQQQKQTALIEDRTLIYVLVKKPENPKPVVLPEPKPSKHEVYFVKYNDNPFDIAARVSEELDKTGTINSIVPLEPDLVNEQHR